MKADLHKYLSEQHTHVGTNEYRLNRQTCPGIHSVPPATLKGACCSVQRRVAFVVAVAVQEAGAEQRRVLVQGVAEVQERGGKDKSRVAVRGGGGLTALGQWVKHQS